MGSAQFDPSYITERVRRSATGAYLTIGKNKAVPYTRRSGANSAPAVHYYSSSAANKVESVAMAANDELVNAKISASEARGETKIARLEGKIDTAVATIIGELHGIRDDVRKSDDYNRDTRWVLFVSIVTAAFALGGLAVGLATYGDALFGRGMNVRDVVQTAVKETVEQTKRDLNKPAQ